MTSSAFVGLSARATSAGSAAPMYVPTVAILRMLVNILLDTLVGAVPVVGDVFDFFYRSNRQNLEIIRRYKTDPKAEPTRTDKIIHTFPFTGKTRTPCVIAATPTTLWATFGGCGTVGL